MGTIRYWLRTDKPNKDGCSPIELIYSQRGKRKYFRTKEKLHVANWNDKEQKAVYIDRRAAKKILPPVDYDSLNTSDEVAETNRNLAAIRKEVVDIEKRFELNKVPFSVEMVITTLKENRVVTTKKESPSNEVFDFIDKYIEDNKASREPGSMSVYKSLKNHLQNFQTAKKMKVTFDKVDYSFFLDFQNYLINARSKRAPEGLGNVTIAKQLSTLKTFLNYARMHGYEIPNGYKDFTLRRENLEVLSLTNDEFEILYNYDLTKNKKWDQVRDVFCFSCATGLRYSDLKQLKREHIKKHEIRLTVKKTKQPLCIPLNPYSFAILEKYQGRLDALPVISNVKMNLYLKELCKDAKINEPVQIVRFRGAKREETTYAKHELVTVHTGRKTFCTLSLERGMSAEQVMSISGHKDYSSFSRYVKVTEQLAKTVMRTAWGEIKTTKLKAV